MATVLTIDAAMERRIALLAQQRDRSPDWIIHEAIRDYIDRADAQAGFAQEARDAWLAYRATGRHLSADETVGWLENWGSDRPHDRPECHD